MMAYNLIRNLMQTSAASYGADIGRLSFGGSPDAVRHFAHAAQAAGNKPRTVNVVIQELLTAIAKGSQPPSPGAL